MRRYGYKTSSWMAYIRGRDFLAVASELEQQEDFKLIPTVVNAAFACELLLKAHLIWQRASNEPMKEHKLKTLFGMLDTEVQEIIKQNSDILRWDEFLVEADNAFVEWRYLHEEDKVMRISVTALVRFAENLLKQYEGTHNLKEVLEDE